MQHIEYAHAAEWIERMALNDLFSAAPETTRARLGLESVETDNAHIYSARNEQHILLNRVIGLGIDGPATEETIHRIRDHYANRGIDEYFLHVQPWVNPAKSWNWLFDAGLEAGRGWTQFIRNAHSAGNHGSNLQVMRIGEEHAQNFARIAAQGFELSEAVIPALASIVGMPGWYHFMTFSGDRPVGTAAMRVHNTMAWFDWAATDPEFRGRGSQTALINKRIEVALELGCRTMFSETGEAVPEDPQHSFRNLMRAGFIPTHTRYNFVPVMTSQSVQLNIADI